MVAQISALNPIPEFQVFLDFFSDINDACCGLVFVIGVVFAVILFLYFKKKNYSINKNSKQYPYSK